MGFIDKLSADPLPQVPGLKEIKPSDLLRPFSGPPGLGSRDAGQILGAPPMSITDLTPSPPPGVPPLLRSPTGAPSVATPPTTDELVKELLKQAQAGDKKGAMKRAHALDNTNPGVFDAFTDELDKAAAAPSSPPVAPSVTPSPTPSPAPVGATAPTTAPFDSKERCAAEKNAIYNALRQSPADLATVQEKMHWMIPQGFGDDFAAAFKKAMDDGASWTPDQKRELVGEMKMLSKNTEGTGFYRADLANLCASIKDDVAPVVVPNPVPVSPAPIPNSPVSAVELTPGAAELAKQIQSNHGDKAAKLIKSMLAEGRLDEVKAALTQGMADPNTGQGTMNKVFKALADGREHERFMQLHNKKSFDLGTYDQMMKDVGTTAINDALRKDMVRMSVDSDDASALRSKILNIRKACGLSSDDNMKLLNDFANDLAQGKIPAPETGEAMVPGRVHNELSKVLRTYRDVFSDQEKTDLKAKASAFEQGVTSVQNADAQRAAAANLVSQQEVINKMKTEMLNPDTDPVILCRNLRKLQKELGQLRGSEVSDRDMRKIIGDIYHQNETDMTVNRSRADLKDFLDQRAEIERDFGPTFGPMGEAKDVVERMTKHYQALMHQEGLDNLDYFLKALPEKAAGNDLHRGMVDLARIERTYNKGEESYIDMDSPEVKDKITEAIFKELNAVNVKDGNLSIDDVRHLETAGALARAFGLERDQDVLGAIDRLGKDADPRLREMVGNAYNTRFDMSAAREQARNELNTEASEYEKFKKEQRRKAA